MRNTKSAFTLVELIVVITILAILGTIAFISLQGYSADARNSKRTSDLSGIVSSLTIKLATGMRIFSLMADDTSALNNPSIAGADQTSTNYKAWVVNYSALGMKTSDFQDPNGDDYVAGASDKIGGVYQIAATIESDNGDVAELIGNYNPRGSLTTSTWAVTVAGQVVTLDDWKDAFRFKVGDTLTDEATQVLVVTKVSADGLSLTVTWNTNTGTGVIGLTAAETAGLIDVVGGTWILPITDGGSNLAY